MAGDVNPVAACRIPSQDGCVSAATTKTEPAPLLRDVHPAFSTELIWLLEAAGHTELAICAHDLRIVERCPCTDDFCQSFYTEPPPDGPYGPGHRNVMLENRGGAGMIVLDVVRNRIMFVEVLFYPPL
jgi:hypothetical protein